MADDKKKDEQGDEAKKKKGLSPVIMIALGAIIGGAGVVFAIPPKTKTIIAPAPVYEEVHVTHPDLVPVTFNPKQRAGKGVMKVSFYFVYTVIEEEGHEVVQKKAFELIKKNWVRAGGSSLELLRLRSLEELNTEAGDMMLKHDLRQRLTQELFGQDLAEGEKPIATITEIIKKDWLTQ